MLFIYKGLKRLYKSGFPPSVAQASAFKAGMIRRKMANRTKLGERLYVNRIR